MNCCDFPDYVFSHFMNLIQLKKTLTEDGIYFQRLKILGILQWKYKYLLLEETDILEPTELMTIVRPIQQGKETLWFRGAFVFEIIDN